MFCLFLCFCQSLGLSISVFFSFISLFLSLSLRLCLSVLFFSPSLYFCLSLSLVALSPKIQVMCSLVISIFLYACESWTLTAELQRRIEAMEMRCYRKILHISYKDHVTNEEVCAKMQQAIGRHEDLLKDPI